MYKYSDDPVNLEVYVLRIIKDNGGLSAPRIARYTGKSFKTVKRYISKLKKSDKIEFRGAPKTGGYYVK